MARNSEDEHENERRYNEMRKAPGLTPKQRAAMIGANTSGIKAIQPGENAAVTIPADPSVVMPTGTKH